MRMRPFAALVIVGSFVLSAGCYKAVIDTGRPASTTIIQNEWANSFIYGLVPPAVVNTASQCPNGVSKVETQHSFLNGIAYIVTFGIYSPITITVTCASAGSASAGDSVEAGATLAERTAAFETAIERSISTGNPVLVIF